MDATVNGHVSFSVLIPLEDARGDELDHLRTWTHGQTFPRERIQVVIASNGSDTAAEEGVRGLLAPQDLLLRVSSKHIAGYWKEAAERATEPWVIVTEAHCLADPGCLDAAAEAIAAEPDMEAAMLRHGHVTAGRAAELNARWFEHTYSLWSEGDWARLNPVGMAVRTDTFRAAGAFEDRYGLFSGQLLSGLLHQRGALVGDISGALVHHVQNTTLREHHEHSADSVRGQCVALTELDPEFCDRYVGRPPVWRARMRYRAPLAREAVGALRDHAAQAQRRAAGGRPVGEAVARDLPWILREISAWLPAAVGGTGPAAGRERARFVANEFAAERLRLPDRWRWPAMLRAEARAEDVARLRWIGDHVAAAPPPPRAAGRWTVDQLDDAEFAGAHAPERCDDGWFRWTQPVAVLRRLPPPGPHTLVLETHGMRPSPMDHLLGVHVDGHALAREAIREDGGKLIVDLPAEIGAEAEGIVIVCRPFEPSRDGSADMRRLGIPLFSVEIRDAR